MLVAMLQNVVGAGVPNDIDPGIARDLFRAVTPEDNFVLQIKNAHSDLQTIEHVGANIRIAAAGMVARRGRS